MLLELIAIPALLLLGFGVGYYVGYRQAKRGLPPISPKPTL